MKYVVGLGNPGKEYAGTRHNLGFMVVDAFVESMSTKTSLPIAWQSNQRAEAEVATIHADGQKITAVKPQTFMNRSGATLKHIFQKQTDWLKRQPLELPELCVVHDDLDIAVGSYKLMFGTGPKVHNGLASIYEQIGTTKFWHMRVGVDGRAGDRTLSGKDYVLKPFFSDEQADINETIQAVVAKLRNWVIEA